MAVKLIIKEPNKILHTKATPVTEITGEVQQLIDIMIETMHVAEGVGLAANQIGSPLDILVASADGQKSKELVLINAQITQHKGQIRSQEGCLSVPGVSSEVTRSTEVTAEGLTREGETKVIHANGLMARILQHEIDHLAGRLYIDHLNLFDRKQLLAKYKALIDAARDIEL